MPADVWMEQIDGSGLPRSGGFRLDAEDPVAILVAEEDKARLDRAMHGLAAKDQSLVQGREEGKTFQKLAEETGWAIATVKRHFQQVLAQLRRKVNPEFMEE
jgi:DNA-directed RNA polymerase specialized sigma24 family protein